MSGPRTKRQFTGAASDPAQRQITSFFSKAANNNSSNPIAETAAAAAAAAPLAGPTLPSHVQANLLSVGMRVRKSVNEGYKTTVDDADAYSAFALWSDAAAAATTTGARPVAVATGRRELVPFCGIHKVGGLAVQPTLYDEEE